uniref:Uncharacterized protein n=1 Tax=Glossina palpalis gambiensis TaxID=67801 RepID=A0A1B0C635_9MUSC
MKTIEDMQNELPVLACFTDLTGEMGLRLQLLEAKHMLGTTGTVQDIGLRPNSVRRAIQDSVASVVMNGSSGIYEGTSRRSESPALGVESLSVLANINIGGISTEGMIDTSATRTIIKSNLQNFISFLSEIPSVSAIICLVNGTDSFDYCQLKRADVFCVRAVCYIYL